MQYANANAQYKNIDKLIHYANRDGRLNLFYSTPATYVDAKHSYGAAWPLKTDDFFPYADCPHCYWTGADLDRASTKVHGFTRERVFSPCCNCALACLTLPQHQDPYS